MDYSKFKYKFSYVCDELTIDMELPGDINIKEMRKNIKRFLEASGYSFKLIEKEFGEEDEDF